jgi:hypothetical protein
MNKQPEMCEKCKKEKSVVGLGGRWLCMKCFEDGLKVVGDLGRALAKWQVGA